MKNNQEKKISVLVVGATGLIGNTLFEYLSTNSNFKVFGTIRKENHKELFLLRFRENLISDMEASDGDKWHLLFKKLKPKIVINCLGITKHIVGGNDPLVCIPLNAIFPHFLNSICKQYQCRFVQISTDCVFAGTKGDYLEDDPSDAIDIYGRSKALGEINNDSSITIRTSTIGHELKSSFGLLDWFLGQKNYCQGYNYAYFSGLTTFELARVIERYVILAPGLKGLYHVGAMKISKFDLLVLLAKTYEKNIEIIPNSSVNIDRSLNSDRFYKATGYRPPSWKQLIEEMIKKKLIKHVY
jgi:dTDP-4-dehydrorhamnose reductase